MSIPPIGPSVVTSNLVTDRAAPESRPSEAAAPTGDSVSVSPSVRSDVKALLEEMANQGLTITPLNEGSARLAAEAAKADLAEAGRPIANANPKAVSDLL